MCKGSPCVLGVSIPRILTGNIKQQRLLYAVSAALTVTHETLTFISINKFKKPKYQRVDTFGAQLKKYSIVERSFIECIRV